MRVQIIVAELNTRVAPALAAQGKGKLLIGEIVEVSDMGVLADGWYRHQLPDGRWIQVESEDGQIAMVEKMSDVRLI